MQLKIHRTDNNSSRKGRNNTNLHFILKTFNIGT